MFDTQTHRPALRARTPTHPPTHTNKRTNTHTRTTRHYACKHKLAWVVGVHTELLVWFTADMQTDRKGGISLCGAMWSFVICCRSCIAS